MLATIRKFVIFLCSVGAIQPALATDTTTVGFYLTTLRDIDYENSSFTASFWLWRLNTNKELKNYYTFEVTNAKDTQKKFSSTEWVDQTENIFARKFDTLFWDYENLDVVVHHEYDISKYPFDDERLVIEFEGTTYYDNWANLQIDSLQSGQGDLQLMGWDVGEIILEKFETTYDTNFGSPGDEGGHTYNGFRVIIPIARKSTFLFIKLFVGLAVAFLIALFSLKINISEADGRFGVCVGALFAVFANMYIVNSNLPMVSQFTYLDKAHIISAILILAVFVVSTVSLRFEKAKKSKRSKRLDAVAFVIVSFLFISLNSLILALALV